MTFNSGSKLREIKELLDVIEVAQFELEHREYKELEKTLKYFVKKVKDGSFDKICPNCNCVVELVDI